MQRNKEKWYRREIPTLTRCKSSEVQAWNTRLEMLGRANMCSCKESQWQRDQNCGCGTSLNCRRCNRRWKINIGENFHCMHCVNQARWMRDTHACIRVCERERERAKWYPALAVEPSFFSNYSIRLYWTLFHLCTNIKRDKKRTRDERK